MLKKFYGNFSAVIFLIVIVSTVGIVQFFNLPIALYPKTSRTSLTVGINSKGLSTEDFRQKYGDSIESKLLAINEVENVYGHYWADGARWKVEFGWGFDEQEALTRTRSALSGLEGQFPKEWGGLSYFFGEHLDNIIAYSVHSDTVHSDDLYLLLQEQIKSRLETIKGLEWVYVSRPQDKEIRVTLSDEKLLENSLLPVDVENALKGKKEDRTLGSLVLKSGETRLIHVPAKSRSLEDVSDTFVKRIGDRDLFVKDIASVSLDDRPQLQIQKGNGKRGIIVVGGVKKDVNLVEVCDSFASTLTDEIKGHDIQSEELINPSHYIRESIRNIGQSVLLGVFIATLVLFLFLGSLSYTVIIGISIPLSLIGGFSIMSLVGIEMNLVSLGAMALAAGMVVDGAIVVLENIVRHFDSKKPQTLQERITVAFDAVSEVKVAVIASMLTTIIVFAPLAFTAPLANAILGDLAKVMVFVLIISILVSLFIVPPLFILLKRERGVRGGEGTVAPPRRDAYSLLKHLYLKTLARLLSNKKLAFAFLASSFLLLISSYFIFSYGLRREIMAKPDSDKVWLNINLEVKEEDVEKTDLLISPYEQILKDEFMGELTHFYSQVRTDGGSILCNLKDKGNVQAFVKKLEKRFKSTPFAQFYVNQWLPSSLEIPQPPVLALQIGGSREEKREALETLRDAVSSLDGVGNTNSKPSPHKEETFSLRIDDKLLHSVKAEVPDFDEEKIYNFVNAHLDNKDISETVLGNEKIPIRLGYFKKDWDRPGALGNLLIRVDDQIVPLRNFFTLHFEEKWEALYTERGKELVKFDAYPLESFAQKRDEVKTKVVEAVDKLKDKFPLISYLDTDAEINENILSLVLALALALLLIWLVVNLQFASFKDSLIIMLAIPFGFIGAAASLFAFSSPLSLNSMLGIILLCGTAVNNSIIFVDFFNHEKESGLNLHDRLLRTADLRFRPILLTTLTTILGMMPLALGFGTGAEVLQSLGITVCGGLTISTLLTLYGVPLCLSLGTKS